MAMVWEGPNAVAAIRQTMGATRPAEAAPGSIRHDFALEVGRNLTHASDTVENGEKEVALWFKPEELGYRARIRNHGHSCFLCEIVIRSQFHTTYEPEA
jgi:nucleoside diphosphate kinase (EC 2.7.4.6)